MRLTNEDVEEFRRIWKQEFHENLSVEEALAEATRLLEFYALLAAHERKGRESRRHPEGEDSN